MVARNFDWDLGHGAIMINKRNVQKKALRSQPSNTPETWTSLYGSVTFNQIGRDFPMGGVNEKGLIIEVLQSSDMPEEVRAGQRSTDEVQWVQYQLDQYASTAEVVKHVNDINISPAELVLQYFVCDQEGSCAVVETDRDGAKAYTGDSLPYPALANDSYPDSLNNLKQYNGFGGTEDILPSYDRFAKAVDLRKDFSETTVQPAFNHAFSILSALSQDNYTQWNIVYDLTGKVLRFRTTQTPTIKEIPFTSFDFRCSTPVQVLTMDINATGNVASFFVPYTKDFNRNLVNLSQPVLANRGIDFSNQIATLPDSSVCLGD